MENQLRKFYNFEQRSTFIRKTLENWVQTGSFVDFPEPKDGLCGYKLLLDMYENPQKYIVEEGVVPVSDDSWSISCSCVFCFFLDATLFLIFCSRSIESSDEPAKKEKGKKDGDKKKGKGGKKAKGSKKSDDEEKKDENDASAMDAKITELFQESIREFGSLWSNEEARLHKIQNHKGIAMPLVSSTSSSTSFDPSSLDTGGELHVEKSDPDMPDICLIEKNAHASIVKKVLHLLP